MGPRETKPIVMLLKRDTRPVATRTRGFARPGRFWRFVHRCLDAAPATRFRSSPFREGRRGIVPGPAARDHPAQDEPNWRSGQDVSVASGPFTPRKTNPTARWAPRGRFAARSAPVGVPTVPRPNGPNGGLGTLAGRLQDRPPARNEANSPPIPARSSRARRTQSPGAGQPIEGRSAGSSAPDAPRPACETNPTDPMGHPVAASRSVAAVAVLGPGRGRRRAKRTVMALGRATLPHESACLHAAPDPGTFRGTQWTTRCVGAGPLPRGSRPGVEESPGSARDTPWAPALARRRVS